MKVTTHRARKRVPATTMLLLFILCALTFSTAQLSGTDTPKPDCDLEFPLNADGDVKHKNCLNKIKGKLDEKLLQMPDTKFIILIDGHRDSKDREGQTLSRSRAEKVGDYLVNNPDGAIDADLIKVRDLNDLCPPEKSSKHNRRVQVWVVPEETELLNPLTKCAPGSKAKPVSDPPDNDL